MRPLREETIEIFSEKAIAVALEGLVIRGVLKCKIVRSLFLECILFEVNGVSNASLDVQPQTWFLYVVSHSQNVKNFFRNFSSGKLVELWGTPVIFTCNCNTSHSFDIIDG